MTEHDGHAHEGAGHEHDHEHEPGAGAAHEHHDGCACEACVSATPLTAEEQAAIAQDPAAGSLAKALKGGFFFLKIAMAVLLLFFVLDRFRSVNEGEVMVVERFGAFLTDDSGAVRVFEPGRMYFLWPEPFDRAIVLRTAEVKTLELGEPFWPRVSAEEALKEETLPQKEDLDPVQDGYNLTGDLNLLHTKWKVQYRISNYRDYLLATQKHDPEKLLAAVVRSAVIRNFAGVTVDDAYHDSGKRSQLFARIDEEVRERLARLALGVELDGGIANQQILPPGFAQTAFIKVNDSQTERKKLVDEARKQESAIHKEAETEALVIRNEALQYRTAVVSRAQADAARVRELSARFTGDPEGLRIYLDQYRYDRLRSALAAARLYFLRDGQNVFWTSPSPEYMDAEAPEKKDDGE